MAYPQWVISQKQKGQEIKKIGNNYYLYEVSSFYSKEKKSTVKKSGKYLGRLTEKGLLSKTNRELSQTPLVRRVCVKEFGASNWVVFTLEKEISLLKVYFPIYWAEILVCCVLRLIHQACFKQMFWYYESSYLSETFVQLRLGGQQISTWLKAVGEDRQSMVKVMQGLQEGEEILLIDSTHIITKSTHNLSAQLGYNSQREFDTQVNLLYLFSQDKQMPIFYRCVQGSVREVRSMQLTLQESGIKQAVLVSDKGFYSANNIDILEQDHWQYVLPLRRNSVLIDYSVVKGDDKKGFDGFFIFEKRPIWYKKISDQDKRRVILFLDESLKYSETQDYLQRIQQQKEGYTLEKFHEQSYCFGTISVISNTIEKQTQIAENKQVQVIETPYSCQKVYQLLKSRNDIEVLNDVYKNVLEADKTYMQNQTSMEAWHFINFLAIRVYYRLYVLLCQQDLNKKYSPIDILLLLQTQKKVKINEQWVDAEVPKKANEVLDKIFPQKTTKT